MGRYAIFIVLALTFSLLTYGQGIKSVFYAAEVDVIQNYNSNQARNIAQSAALVALAKLIDPSDTDLEPDEDEIIYVPSTPDLFEDWPLMQGSYRYRVQNFGDSLVVLNSEGRFDETVYTHSIVMDFSGASWNPDLSRAVFANGRIDLTGSARITGHAGTNATGPSMVTFDGTAGVDSTLSIGPGGIGPIVVTHPSYTANWYNELDNLSSPQSFTLPDFPDSPATTPCSCIIDATWWPIHPPLTPADYEGKYINEIRLATGLTLDLHVGSEDRVLHVGYLNINGGYLNIIGTGKLTIFVENNLNMGGSGTINNNRTSETMFTYYRGTNNLTFAGSTRFTGGLYARTTNIAIGGGGGINGNIISGGTSVTIDGGAYAVSRVVFAPNAHVRVLAGATVHGAIVADRFTADGGTRVTYNPSLDDPLPEFGSERTLAVRFWR